ncbi:MAG: hypothetical protein M3Q27_13355 [Actinomycetota bacterium]|nr:hypothetical protein [Actinomycetota bacterium]
MEQSRRTTGTVAKWVATEGWGVVDTADVPGGCRFDLAVVKPPGEVRVGQVVELEYVGADGGEQDFRATRVLVRPDALNATPGA